MTPLGPLQIQHGRGYFTEAHLGYGTGGCPQQVERPAGIEVVNAPEIVIVQIQERVNPAPGQPHERQTVFQQRGIGDLNVEIVQFLQEAVLTAPNQLAQVIGDIVGHGVVSS